MNRHVRVQCLKNKSFLAEKCNVADRFWTRFRGLMGRKLLARGEGMFFPEANSIHMWFMRISLDVVFLLKVQGEAQAKVLEGKLYVVSSLRRNLRPWSLLPATDWKATDTLELPAGSIDGCSLSVGDEVCIS